MHTLMGTHVNYELATQRRSVLVESARQGRLARLLAGRAATTPVVTRGGSIITFKAAQANPQPAPAATTIEHASARVA